jgi:4a-hydroxytetrahydrobiopterin dehydratase
MSELAARRCEPCRGGTPPLTAAQIEPLQSQLDPGWQVVDGHHLSRLFKFQNFAEAIAFVNRVGGMAEEQGHHPDVYLAWGRARIDVWTHKIDGLHEADFVFAAKCDVLYSQP